MTEDEKRESYLRFLRKLKSTGKAYTKFSESVQILQEAADKGLDDEDICLITDVIIDTDLGAAKWVSLIKCLIPKFKIPEKAVKILMTWCLANVNELPITVSTIIIQWINGLWDYQLIDRKVINIYYDVLFCIMLKRGRLERHIARLIYVLTKPEDVTRRDVSRLLALHRKYKTPQKHIIALLSLFKSYKPELVPERIESMNIDSVWKPVSETLRLKLEGAKNRMEAEHFQFHADQKHFNWDILKVLNVRRKQRLLPSVGYFHIGSNIFKDQDTKSIFDVSSLPELGIYHLNVELPCNAVSLLANTAGYHLLTYADFQYQSRFTYNLYNSLVRGFILESDKFSAEEMDKLLDMTVEFSRYMQEGVLVVNLFFHEYLHFNTGEHQSKLLALLQWMISVSIAELQEKVLVHVQNIFYESTVSVKCEIIKTLRILITNLFVNQGFDECRQTTPAPFLGQGPMDNLADIIPVLTKIIRNLIVTGLNVHSFDIMLLSEALTFYEQICTLETQSDTIIWTVAPPAVIYGGFVTKSCAMLSRVCALLLRYRERNAVLAQYKTQNLFKEKVSIISVYAQDIVTALWYDMCFSDRDNGYFLRNISNEIMEDLETCDLDSQLNIKNHYAILPYKCTLNTTGMDINTKRDAISVALHYYPAIDEFLAIFHE